MSNYPDNIRYTKDHEWVRVEGTQAVIGITDYAAEQLGDVVHVELPQREAEFGKGDAFGVVESVKSVSDVYLPLTGKIIEVNDMLIENAGIIGEDPYGEGWIAKIEFAKSEEMEDLLTADQYESFLSEES